MFWRWNFEIEICNLQLKLSFVFPLLWDVDLKIEIALCMNDFLCSSIFTDIPFSLLCLFFSLCYSLCLLPFSGMSFVFECWFGHGHDWNLPMVMNRLGLPGVEISILWGSVLVMSRKSFRDPSVMARLKVMSDLALDLNGSSCLSRS